MCTLPQSVVDVLDCVPMRELQEYIDDRRVKKTAPLKRRKGLGLVQVTALPRKTMLLKKGK
ncbi:MAG TPA: hypothetical protein VK536_04150 [Candidatus Limnocylindrales bacterium]|nr:hypothetical protein [Candidatus Limnocylindrales bacterium]